MVAKGNPKGLRGVEDLGRPGVRYVNRQKGSGTRVLLWASPRRTAMMPPMEPTWLEAIPRERSLCRSRSAASSSSAIFSGMLAGWGAEPLVFPIVPDRPEALARALETALERCDIVLLGAGCQHRPRGSGGDDGVGGEQHLPGADVLPHLADVLPADHHPGGHQRLFPCPPGLRGAAQGGTGGGVPLHASRAMPSMALAR